MLHSHDMSYSHDGTSGQQQITCFEGRDDNDAFVVEGNRVGARVGPSKPRLALGGAHS